MKMKQQNKLSFYLYVQKKLLDHARDKKLTYKQALHAMKAGNSRVPKNLYPIILKELEKMELIKIINRNQVIVINSYKCKKIERNNLNRFYQEVGIF